MVQKPKQIYPQEPHFYDFTAVTIQGNTIDMLQYNGYTILVVNTASKCGHTPQLEGLEKLYQQYKNRGLIILAFPCNQFGGQEPGDAESIKQTCFVNYGVSFPVFQKIDVNGKNAHPLFTFLKSKLKGWLGSRVNWNFTKFLIDKDGNPVKRFSPGTKPDKLVPFIEKLL